MTDRVAAAIAIEIHGITLQSDRVGLDEAAKARKIHAVSIIVEAECIDIFPPSKQEAVSVIADPAYGSIPSGDRRLAEHVIAVFLQAQKRFTER